MVPQHDLVISESMLQLGSLQRDFTVHRGSYMSAHILLNLLKELGKRDKMQGMPSILSLLCNEFIKFNNTRARMVDSIYHTKLGLLLKVSKGAKIRNRYNQVPHLTQDTNRKVTNSELDTTNESQEVSHFCRKNVIILSLCRQRCYGPQNVSRKSVNH